jgi:hypothetical protein
MSKETSRDTVRRQYSDGIHRAYLQSHSGADLDPALFQTRLNRLMKQAEADGIPYDEFRALVSGRLPRLFPKLVISVASAESVASKRRTA